ncbi:MAG: GvpL/GvpF family gas vesicle protein [Labilithrix sp.]|nr:GvpL/GvpF family gas vesicle protein [Labilithrix sp.]
MGAMASYLYCAVKGATTSRRGLGSKAPKGLAGTGAPRLVDVGGGWSVIVADAPLSLYDAGAIDAKLRDIDWVGARAGEHEAVVEHALGLGTVVPMKLFTLFSTEERAKAHVAKMKRALDKAAAVIEGCEEWSLRVLLDEKRARAKAPAAKKVTSGTSFLARKKALEDERRSAGARGAAEADALFAALAKIAKKAERRPPPNRDLAARVFLDAAFLVPRGAVKKLQDAVGKAAKTLVPDGFDLTLSGPWPAYSFIPAS